jgi:phage FluMu gp28-like protein
MTEAALLRGVCWIISPSYATGNPVFDDLRRLAAQIPGCQVNRSERSIKYPGGGVCAVKSGDDPALLRGVSLDFVVFDEAAHMIRLQEIWLEVIRPALADRQGKALFCSTPTGASHYFHTLFQLGQDGGQTDWQSWQFPTSANPFIDLAEIESARRQMSERQFAQEFEAQFMAEGSIFRLAGVGKAPPQPGPQPGHEYTIGVDWGRSGDYTVICIFDGTERRIAHLDRFTGLSYEVQLARVQAAIERWRPVQSTVEMNAIGGPLLETLQKRLPDGAVTGFTTNNANKAALVDGLALALERQSITLLDDPVLIAELQAYEMETLPSGLIRYSAPAGAHDDCVMALLLAYGPYMGEGAPVEIAMSYLDYATLDGMYRVYSNGKVERLEPLRDEQHEHKQSFWTR